MSAKADRHFFIDNIHEDGRQRPRDACGDRFHFLSKEEKKNFFLDRSKTSHVRSPLSTLARSRSFGKSSENVPCNLFFCERHGHWHDLRDFIVFDWILFVWLRRVVIPNDHHLSLRGLLFQVNDARKFCVESQYRPPNFVTDRHEIQRTANYLITHRLGPVSSVFHNPWNECDRS